MQRLNRAELSVRVCVCVHTSSCWLQLVSISLSLVLRAALLIKIISSCTFST